MGRTEYTIKELIKIHKDIVARDNFTNYISRTFLNKSKKI